MHEVTHFGGIVLLVSAALSVALLSNKLSERLRVPTAAFFLLAAALISDLWPRLGDALSIRNVERIAVVALIVILFDGGMRVGWSRFRESAVPIVSLGLLGTFATAGLMTLAAHYLLDFSWQTAGLLGAALAPTDPAVMFSVFGRKEIGGRTGTILEGESGANDPVGIALMLAAVSLAQSDSDVTGSRSRRVRPPARRRDRRRRRGCLSASCSPCVAWFCRTRRSIRFGRWRLPG